MKTKSTLLIFSLLLAGLGNAFAQPTSPATNCTPTQANPQQGTLSPNGTTTADRNSEPLSDKLAKSDGVLCPPGNVDADMHVPPPNVGTMPVIPPPGSPGGDPSLRPK
jgi:hypothetical protein